MAFAVDDRGQVKYIAPTVAKPTGTVVSTVNRTPAPASTQPSIGTVVKTQGGDYKVVAPGTAGAAYNPASGLWSVKVSGAAAPTTSSPPSTPSLPRTTSGPPSSQGSAARLSSSERKINSTSAPPISVVKDTVAQLTRSPQRSTSTGNARAQFGGSAAQALARDLSAAAVQTAGPTASGTKMNVAGRPEKALESAGIDPEYHAYYPTGAQRAINTALKGAANIVGLDAAQQFANTGEMAPLDAIGFIPGAGMISKIGGKSVKIADDVVGMLASAFQKAQGRGVSKAISNKYARAYVDAVNVGKTADDVVNMFNTNTASTGMFQDLHKLYKELAQANNLPIPNKKLDSLGVVRIADDAAAPAAKAAQAAPGVAKKAGDAAEATAEKIAAMRRGMSDAQSAAKGGAGRFADDVSAGRPPASTKIDGVAGEVGSGAKAKAAPEPEWSRQRTGPEGARVKKDIPESRYSDGTSGAFDDVNYTKQKPGGALPDMPGVTRLGDAADALKNAWAKTPRAAKILGAAGAGLYGVEKGVDYLRDGEGGPIEMAASAFMQPVEDTADPAAFDQTAAMLLQGEPTEVGEYTDPYALPDYGATSVDMDYTSTSGGGGGGYAPSVSYNQGAGIAAPQGGGIGMGTQGAPTNAVESTYYMPDGQGGFTEGVAYIGPDGLAYLDPQMTQRVEPGMIVATRGADGQDYYWEMTPEGGRAYDPENPYNAEAIPEIPMPEIPPQETPEDTLAMIMDSMAPYLESQYAAIDSWVESEIAMMKEAYAARGMFNSDVAITAEQQIREAGEAKKAELYAQVLSQAIGQALSYSTDQQQLGMEQQRIDQDAYQFNQQMEADERRFIQELGLEQSKLNLQEREFAFDQWAEQAKISISARSGGGSSPEKVNFDDYVMAMNTMYQAADQVVANKASYATPDAFAAAVKANVNRAASQFPNVTPQMIQNVLGGVANTLAPR